MLQGSSYLEDRHGDEVEVVALSVVDVPLEEDEHGPTNTKKKIQSRCSCSCLKRSVVGCLKTYWKALLVAAALYIVGIIFSTVLKEEVQLAVEFFGDKGAFGGLLFVLSFTVLLQIGVGGTLMEIAAAFVFDEYFQIFLINTLAKNMAKSVGFAIGKYVLHDWIKKNVLNNSKFFAKDLAHMIEAEPLKYATLWGFAYVPSWTATYGLPVLGCPFWKFIIASNISGIPFTALRSYVGILTRETIENVRTGEDVDVAEWIGAGIGVVLLFVSLCVLGHYIRKQMKRQQAELEAAEQEARRDDETEGTEEGENQTSTNLPSDSDDAVPFNFGTVADNIQDLGHQEAPPSL